VLRNLRAELDLTMALTGCRTLADITRDRLVVMSREVVPPSGGESG
jgi:isopentenyl diphosphate isomerase/L-lactate dehydrogenase-like FMN-dependent dehydrogenase